MRQFQCLPTTYVTEIKKTYLETHTLNKYHVRWLPSFKHLKLPISIKIPNCLYLHDSYITRFDFMNYAFAKLVVACGNENLQIYLVLSARVYGCGRTVLL